MTSEIISTGGALPAPYETQDTDQEPEGEATALEVERRSFETPADMHGWRLDKALAQLVPEFSRSYLQQLMADGAVEWRGVPALKPASRVTVGDSLRIELRPTQQAQAFKAEEIALQVVFEDEHLLVIDKPAGLVVHPAAGNWSGTLLNGLLAYHVAASSLPRAGIVHRLDKDTSGLMLVGKSRQAVDALVRAIAARDVQREYLALAHGHWQGTGEQTVDQPIGRDSHNRLRMAVMRPEATTGKPAQTTVRFLGSTAQVSFVACKLHTGRTHQIRVHMAWLGHPLVGDTLYGGRAIWGLQRQALHAARLRLAHPVSGVSLEFRSTPPGDLLEALAQAGLQYNEQALGWTA